MINLLALRRPAKLPVSYLRSETSVQLAAPASPKSISVNSNEKLLYVL